MSIIVVQNGLLTLSQHHQKSLTMKQLKPDKGKGFIASTQNLEFFFSRFPRSCLVFEPHDELGLEENGSCINGEVGTEKEEYLNTAKELQPENVERHIKRQGDGNNILCLVILLAGKGVRVSMPFLNAFP